MITREDAKDKVKKRFWAKVNKTDTCWMWVAYIGQQGYGKFRFNGRSTTAHRVSYEIHNGPIPNKLHVCHSCDVKQCVNPDHLWLGTAKDNMADRDAKGRGGKNTNSKKTHCKSGHPFAGENLVLIFSGDKKHRVCRICRANTWRLIKRKQRARYKLAKHI